MHSNVGCGQWGQSLKTLDACNVQSGKYMYMYVCVVGKGTMQTLGDCETHMSHVYSSVCVYTFLPPLPSPPLCPQEREKPPPDDLHGLRFHCWVLVLAGKREVPLNFFIEATTSKTYSTDYEEYLGIESLWNHRNYWVNMQDCAEGVKVCAVWGGICRRCDNDMRWDETVLIKLCIE